MLDIVDQFLNLPPKPRSVPINYIVHYHAQRPNVTFASIFLILKNLRGIKEEILLLGVVFAKTLKTFSETAI